MVVHTKNFDSPNLARLRHLAITERLRDCSTASICTDSWRGCSGATYWSKLPGLDRKIKVGASWLLDLVCGPELVQTKLDSPPDMTEEHYEPDEIVVHQGDSGNRIYIIISGKFEVSKNDGSGQAEAGFQLGEGDCFGIAEILDNTTAQANVRCSELSSVVTYHKRELEPLLSLPEVRRGFERMRSMPPGKG